MKNSDNIKRNELNNNVHNNLSNHNSNSNNMNNVDFRINNFIYWLNNLSNNRTDSDSSNVDYTFYKGK